MVEQCALAEPGASRKVQSGRTPWRSGGGCLASLRRAGATCLLATLLLLPVLHSEGEPLMPMLTGAGPGWVGFRFASDGGRIDARIEGFGGDHPVQAAAILYDGDGHYRDGRFVTYNALTSEQGVFADATTKAGENIHYDRSTRREQAAPFGIDASFNQPGSARVVGTFQLLLWVVGGSLEGWRATIAGDGLAVLAAKQGSSGFLFTGRDFRAAANVQAYPLGVGASTVMDGDLALRIEHTLVGLYSAAPAGYNALSVTTPDGDLACGCFFYRFDEPRAAGPGDYVFHLSGYGAGSSSHTEVYLGGVDAELPVEP